MYYIFSSLSSVYNIAQINPHLFTRIVHQMHLTTPFDKSPDAFADFQH